MYPDATLFSNKRRYQPLVLVAVALAGGIVVARHDGAQLLFAGHSPFPWSGFATWWWLATICLGAWFIAWRRSCYALAALCLLATTSLVGAAWHDLRWREFSSDQVARYATMDAAPACVTATALASPVILPAPRHSALRAIPGGERSRIELEVTGIRDGTAWLPAKGRCQLLVNGHQLGLHAGDQLKVFGQLRRPSTPRNPGEFDFAAHARTKRRLATLATESPDCVSIRKSASGWTLNRLLESVRASGKQLLQNYLGPEHAALASAILLGAREGLPNEEVTPFFVTGTIHLLVVSGLHVGILALGLYGALRLGWLPRRFALSAIAVVVVLFAAVAEMQPPVMRAAVLVVLFCAAAWSGRRAVELNSLAAAAIVVLAVNPVELFQVGTQLSFLAVATFVALNTWWPARFGPSADPLDQLVASSRPWYARAIRWIGRWNGWLLLATAAVWLTALPLVLDRFHVVTPIALVISPVVWLLVLVSLWAGFLTLLGGWLLPPVAIVCGPICAAGLTGLEGVVNWAQSVPAGHFWAPGPPRWWLLGFYGVLVATMIFQRLRLRPRWLIALTCVWIISGFTPPIARAWFRSDELRCTFVAMGHGACVAIETPSGKTLLYDAGSLGSPEYATQTVANFLWHRGIMRIDGIILSHADVDHYNAVPGLLERFRVGTVYVSPLMFDWFGATGPSGGPGELYRAIKLAGVPIREVWAGDQLRLDPEVVLSVLHPPREGVIASDNANSVTITLEYGDRRLLLPGDLESPGLEDVIAELPCDCDVLLAPHHGSRRSDPPGFAAWCTPEWVIISGGSDADSVVRRTYELAGARVFNTGRDGAVEFDIGQGPIRVANCSPSSR